ncbi:hypothetical protein [Sulfuricystis thermophila]|uniref:hypothetical protein n=1 Tax=Sulfuricystis thermophila TaxID=2496847 RepID=UPI0024DF4A02|nr:hypothetical protein [Sulfuricystis thermophila]
MRFNAVKHGILSRCTVLPHEDAAEFADLLAALVDEHQPAGATEMHLVEDLAAIMWRKRRVMVAEGATINRGLLSVVNDRHDEDWHSPSPVMAAVPFERGLPKQGTDLRDLVGMSPADVTERQREAQHDLAATERAAAILRRGGDDAYDKALRALLPDSRDWWQEYVDDEEYPATAEGLAEFIREHLMPLCIAMQRQAQHHEAIKAQAIGEGLQVHRLEKIARYETHLDRKFERTLAMLVKLKELRSGR